MPIKENVGFVERIHKAGQEGLSLDGLTSVVDQVNAVLSTPEGKKRMEEFKSKMDAEIAEFKARYGKDWFSKWFEHRKKKDCERRGFEDTIVHEYNECIYEGRRFSIISPYAVERIKGYEDYCREVYGDRYEELRYHEAKDPEVSELLVRHAIKTGKWRELPKELHSMYHEMAGDIG